MQQFISIHFWVAPVLKLCDLTHQFKGQKLFNFISCFFPQAYGTEVGAPFLDLSADNLLDKGHIQGISGQKEYRVNGVNG